MSPLPPSQIKIIQKALDPWQPVAIWHFGSTAQGHQRPDSDLDIAFLQSPEQAAIDSLTLFELAQDMACLLNQDVDLVELGQSSTVMASEIIRTGRLLLDKDPDYRLSFTAQVLSDFARLNEERRPIFEKLGYL